MSGYRDPVESMIVKELIPLIDGSYPTKASTDGRVVCGFSMGGAGSVRLSLQHPELFCGAGSWGGALSFRGNGEQAAILTVAKNNSDKLKKSNFALLTINGDQDRPESFRPLQKLSEQLELSHQIITLEDTNHNLGKYYELSGDAMIDFLAKRLTAK